MDITRVKAKDKTDGKVKVFPIATATQEQVNAACSEWLDNNGVGFELDNDGGLHV